VIVVDASAILEILLGTSDGARVAEALGAPLVTCDAALASMRMLHASVELL
jgi:predicted nucleic acid-binding protein